MKPETLQIEAGPLLQRLADAQRLEEQVVGYERIEAIADAVARRAAELGDCLVWPVGAAAERVAGVVTVRTRGAVAVGTWNAAVEGQRVLLFTVAAITSISLEDAAAQVGYRGAAEVYACAVRLPQVDGGNDASFPQLETSQLTRSVALVAAA